MGGPHNPGIGERKICGVFQSVQGAIGLFQGTTQAPPGVVKSRLGPTTAAETTKATGAYDSPLFSSHLLHYRDLGLTCIYVNLILVLM